MADIPRTDSPRALRKFAKERLTLAQKVWNYRRDLLKEADREELGTAREEAYAAWKTKPLDAAKLRAALERLERALERTGGVMVHKHAWYENFETLLVVAILALGVRAHFLMFFHIPTNSMYPTYHGMTPAVYAPGEAPNAAVRLVRKFALGARWREMEAPATGEVWVPHFDESTLRRFVQRYGGPPKGEFAYDIVQERSFGLFPSLARRYTFLVGGSPVQVTVPLEFDMDWAIRERFGLERGEIPRIGVREGVAYVRTGDEAAAGEPFFQFEILAGDWVMVDRFSYHFIPPAVGDPFVFRTSEVPAIFRGGRGEDTFYIKRLVGQPGDTLRVDEPVLYRNGKPVEGAPAFAYNHDQVGAYEGYNNLGSAGFDLREPLELPAGMYFAMGDNSDQSGDSRQFGFVPQSAIEGRALFVYYPFSARWGLAEQYPGMPDIDKQQK